MRTLIADLRISKGSADDRLMGWLEKNFTVGLGSLVSVRQSTRCCVESEACYIPEAADEVCFL